MHGLTLISVCFRSTMERTGSPVLELEDYDILQELDAVIEEGNNREPPTTAEGPTGDQPEKAQPVVGGGASVTPCPPPQGPSSQILPRHPKISPPTPTPEDQQSDEEWEEWTDPIEGRGPGPVFLPTPENLCWRCGRSGHRRNTCKGEPVLFCSRCGRIGTLSRECICDRQLTSHGRGRRPIIKTDQCPRCGYQR